MAVEFSGECSNCGYCSGSISGGHAAIILDTPVESHFSDSQDNRIVLLHHPLEFLILEEFGHTTQSATREGRVLAVGDCICNSCGHLYEVRKLSRYEGFTGCLIGLVIGAITGIVSGWWLACGWLSDKRLLSVLAGFLTGWAALMIYLYISSTVSMIYMRWKFAARAREFETEQRCPKCGSRDAARPGDDGLRMLCPNCNQRTIKVRGDGIS